MARGSVARVAPELGYLVALQARVETTYQFQDQQIDRSREVRELRNPIPIDPDLLLVPGLHVHDPTATSAGFQTGDTLSLNFPKVTVTPSDLESDPAQQRAEDLEHWLTEVLRLSGRNPLGMHGFAATVDAAVNDGAGWAKVLWKPDVWAARNSLRLAQFTDEDSAGGPNGHQRTARQQFEQAKEEAKRAAGPPIVWRVPDVRTVYPVFYGDSLGEVVEITKRPESQLFRQYRLARSPAGGILLPEEVGQGRPSDKSRTRDSLENQQSELTFLEHWDDEWATYACVGKKLDDSPEPKVLKQWRHHYGRVPYFPAMGLLMNHWRNRKTGWGITEPMRFLVELRSFLWTLMGNLAARDTFPLLQEVLVASQPSAGAYVTQGDDRRGELMQVVRWGLREILRARTGYEYRPLPMPEVAESLKTLMAAVDQALDKLQAPRFNGELGGLEGAGFAINQVLSYEAVRLGRIKQQLEEAVAEICYFIGYLTRNRIQERVWVYASAQGAGWLGLGPDELARPFKLAVELDPQQPSAKLVEQRMIHEAIDKGTLSLDQGIALLGRSPAEVRRGRRMDQIRQSDLYQKLADQALLAELGRGDLMALTLQAQLLAEQGNPAMGVPPPGGAAGGAQGPPVQAMGNGIVPDMGALAAGRHGAGAGMGQGQGPQGGTAVGVPSMAGPPAASQAGVAGQQPLIG